MLATQWNTSEQYTFLSSNVQVGSFNGQPVFGGDTVFNRGMGSVFREYTQLPLHNMIYFDIQIVFNDQVPTDTEIDLLIGFTYTYRLDRPAGMGTLPGSPNVSVSHLIGKIPHQENSLMIQFGYYNWGQNMQDWLAFRDISLSFREESVESTFFAITLPKVASPNDFQRTNCSAGYFNNGGVCVKCHASCRNCFGPSNSQCYSCTPGFSFVDDQYQCLQCPLNCAFCSGTSLGQCLLCQPGYTLDFDGTCTSSNTCKTSPFIIKKNTDITAAPSVSSISFCAQPCSSSSYNFWNYTCASSCDWPLQQVTSNNISFCEFPCNKTNNEYLYQNGSCATTCNYQIRNETGYLFCEHPCKEYLYQNQSCLSTCPAPFISAFSPGPKVCNFPCAIGEYLYNNGTCLSTCPDSYLARVEGISLFCSYPCASNEFLYSNGTCSSTCRQNFLVTMEGSEKFCNYPCSIGSYLYDNGTCSETCPSNFNATGQGFYQFCSSCPADKYLYANGSCLSSCGSEFSIKIEGGMKYCDSIGTNILCAPGSFLYENGTCLPFCGLGYVSRIEDNITFCDRMPQAQYPCHIGFNYDNLMTTNCSNHDNNCDPGYFQYQNSSCIQHCVDPYYAILRNGSAYCYSPSSFPDNSTNNITCPSGTYLSGDTCFSNI